MKRLYLLLSLFAFVLPVYSQIQTTTLPSPGFDARIKKAVDNIRIIDTHEHLETEERRIEQTNLDFTHLFRQYAIEDLVSASNLHGLISVIFSDHFSLQDRWELFKPFFQVMRTTGYGRAPLIAAMIYLVCPISMMILLRSCRKK